ncbi:response regulator [Sulfurovum sp. bin170]|uniref:response regulator transcription factor n=1 Tax=Sulfurovum sp. bin170 TaxID=2695268 RepID=UPI0013E00E5B|nr:response regulator [Sulfurovum sp. bin170]NEW61754.1 response regulator [Sulfurovum sp. bin170]
MNLNEPKYKLLYIEDNATTRLFTSMFLKPHFKEIYEAGNGVEAIQIYKEQKPDVIITDIEMPQMSGLEFCKKIREEDLDTPIIITTAYTSVEYLLEAVSLNLIKYLGKPLNEDELMKALEGCFERLESQNPSVIRLTKEIYYDSFNHSLSINDKIVHISASESLLLDILIKNRNRVVSYIEIENFVWSDTYMSLDALRSLVRKIRKSIGKEVIENISKTGYRIKLYG